MQWWPKATMLTYFLAPYPGEWWYSVLCRYHVRSGNPKQQTTIKELFPGRVTAAMSSVFPNSTIRQVVTQLPSEIFDTKTIILEHTLFLYYTRFYSLQRKEEVLERLCLGETIVITSIRRFSELSKWTPHYCPQCVEEDRKNYGEAYWHIVHQIPLMALCPVHGCQLFPVEEIDPSRLESVFYPLECMQLTQQPLDATVAPWLSMLCKILYDYAVLPLEAAAMKEYNNLAISLSNMGYGVIQKNSPHTILDAKRLYGDLTEFFGMELVRQILGNDVFNINRICKWGMVVPERYALLQCFAGIDSEAVFNKQRIRDKYENQLLALQKTGVLYGKKQLAEQLDMTVQQLDLLAKKYGIRPFWTQNGNVETDKTKLHNVKVTFTDKEFELFKGALKKSGFRYDSHFARHCIMSVVTDDNRNKRGK